ncbi:MAG: SPFH domain-containing protein [Plesiomonas shigelloides]
MKKLLLVCGAVLAMVGCGKVPAGNVGVKVDLLGSDKGVNTEELGVGRYWIGINEELYLFPTFTQNYTWTKSKSEGSDADESITFQSIEGMEVNADVGISYFIRPEKAVTVFQKYRKGVDEITSVFIRNMVRDSLVKNASNMKIDSIYGAGKNELIQNVQRDVKTQVEDIGIVIEKIYWVSSPRLPQSVVASINSKIEATQKALLRENEIQQSKAEAQKQIEQAKGEAESVRLKAIAAADAIKIKAEALRANPEVLQLEAIGKWDGVMPKMIGSGAVPFVDVDKITK